MLEIVNYLKTRYLDEKGQGIVEYALILVFVAALAGYLGSSGTLGKGVQTAFSNIATTLTTKASS